MIVADTIIYIVVVLLAIVFTFSAFDQPTETRGEPLGYGEILAFLRASSFFFISAILWMSMAFMTFSLNNCSFSFGACFTSPTYATTTGTIFANPWSWPIGLFFVGISGVMLFVGSVMVMYLVLPSEKLPKALKIWGKK